MPTRLWGISAWRYAFPAALISRLGDVVFDLTVVLWISTDIARGQSWAPAAVSGVLLAAAVPVLVVGPWAGVYVDRHDRHRILVLSNLAQAAAIASVLLIPLLHGLSTGWSLTWIYAAIAVANAAGQFFNQARLVMIARTVPERLRITAFSVQGSANSIVYIIGPPLAAPLLFTAGVNWALAIDAVSFLVSSLLLHIVRWDSAPAAETTHQRFLESLAEGAGAIIANKLLLAISIAVSLVTLGTGAINVLEVFFIVDVLHRQPSLLGVVNMMFAAGGVAGMVAAPRLERRVGAPRIFLWGLALSGTAVIIYSRTTSLWLAMVVYFLMAVPIGALNTVITPLFMRSVPDAVLGRATVALQVFPTVANLTATALTGWLVSTALRGLDLRVAGSHFGPIDTVFAVAGLIFIVTAIAVWRPVSRGPSGTRDHLAPAVTASDWESRS